MVDKVISLNSKKRRSQSSRKWLLRQLNDPFVRLSKEKGYRSRAAFKLIEIDDKFKILKPKQTVVDLGCAPGGWLQVITQRVGSGNIIGVDLQDVEPMPGVSLIIDDFTKEETVNKILSNISDGKVDVVVSDMAAPACGITKVDHIRIMSLINDVFSFCELVLNKNGSMVAKVLRGGTESVLLTKIKQKFKKVVHFKPSSSRTDSAEMYIVCIGYK